MELDRRVKVSTFSGVTNAAVLIEGMGGEEPGGRFAIVDLGLVCSHFHLAAAVFKALYNEEQGRMKTKSISSEVMYQLSSTTKINEALRQYGVKPESTLVAFVSIDEDPLCAQLLAKVEGSVLDSELLGSPQFLTAEKVSIIAKAFKLTKEELQFSSLDDAIATRLATKDTL
ncbi:kinase binding protein CGI-121-domain-containing protein [Ochromonadaceae sp. CCMP2298]|nr:kinase binding protein CGI-121-domain-containing protein [Ochromonadaceae sp. CCMP2298]|mmetsp:Transcript_1079/g.2410  ORF Transcript_1079/g.2410 Transcript_1079/m.2410 type:complete len:172 (+) Transcript_1079:208-723(+)